MKLANNREARTGLQEQLVDRYVRERGAPCGLFVAAWMGTQLPTAYRPLWKSVVSVKAELDAQAAKAASSSTLDIRSVIIDLSLPLTSRGSRPKEKGAKSSIRTVKKDKKKAPLRKTGKKGPKKGAAKKSASKAKKAKGKSLLGGTRKKKNPKKRSSAR